MGINQGIVEIKDGDGTTVHYSGTVGTSPINVPPSADKVITEVLVRNPNQSPNSKVLSVSFTNGSTYLSLGVGEFVIWPIKGDQKQIKILGNQANVSYEVVVNYEVNA